MLSYLNVESLAANTAPGLERSPASPRAVGLKRYAHGEPVTLSEVLPTLENFGLQVIRQEPHEIKRKPGSSADRSLWVQEFEVRHSGCELSPDRHRKL